VDRADDGLDVDVALVAVLLDRGEQRPHAVDRGQQRGDGVRGDRLDAVAEPGQQRLTRVGQRLQAAERQEAAGALDRVDRAEDARDQIAGARVLLQRDEVPVDLVQVLMALHEELADDLTKVFHGLPPARRSKTPHRPARRSPETTRTATLRRSGVAPGPAVPVAEPAYRLDG
jgi:hypothetical protein